jgi:hypothetical protein
MTRPISRRHLIAGGAGAAGAAALTVGPVAATGHETTPTSGPLIPLGQPVRLFDSRIAESFWDGRKLTDGDVVAVTAGPQPGAGMLLAVFVNITITQTEGAGFLSVRGFETRDDPPPITTSNINWTADDVTLANMTLSQIGAENSIEVHCIGAGASTHVIVDLQGYVPFQFEDEHSTHG